MSETVQAAYFGDWTFETIIQRIQHEIDATDDQLMRHIYAAAAVQFARVKSDLDIVGGAKAGATER